MKFMKKAMAMVLSLAMLMAMCVNAFAATNITITGKEKHSYEIYQIFTGKASGEKLVNLKWGKNGTGTEGSDVDTDTLTAINAVNTATDAEKLAVVTRYAKLTSDPIWKGDSGSYSAESGYYLIKDYTTADNEYTTFVLQVVKEQEITVDTKTDSPNFEKKLKDTNDSTGDVSDWQDSADYDIGDKIPFKLEGTVASNYSAYTTYYFAFHDKEETGLTFDKDSVKVYADDQEITSGYEVVTAPTDGCTFEVVFANLKDIASVKAGSKIRVEYESTLNDKAVLGNQGNVNQAKLEFSNNPNTDAKGSTGWDNVIVFTYQVVVNKVDQDDAALAGAAFKLEKKIAQMDDAGNVVKDEEGNTQYDWVEIKSFEADGATSFTFSGLDDGNYKLTEITTPTGYNTIAAIEFTVTAEHTIEWSNQTRTDILTSLNGTATSGSIEFTKDLANGSLTTTVVNKSGTELPGTGGMGTTIFYVIGGMLMAAALVLFTTKKRMEANK